MSPNHQCWENTGYRILHVLHNAQGLLPVREIANTIGKPVASVRDWLRWAYDSDLVGKIAGISRVDSRRHVAFYRISQGEEMLRTLYRQHGEPNTSEWAAQAQEGGTVCRATQ